MINALPPNDDMNVAIQRTVESIFPHEDNSGIIFRDERNFYVSIKGAMMLIKLDPDNTLSFKGLPQYQNPDDGKAEVYTNLGDDVKSNVSHITPKTVQGMINDVMDASEQDNKKEKADDPKPPEPPKVDPNAKNDELSDATNLSDIDRYSDSSYKQAILEANLDIDQLIKDVEAKPEVDKQSIPVLKRIRPELKDVYTDGHDYVFVTVFDTKGKVTTGKIDKGHLKFISDDWRDQSELIKKER